MKLLRVYIRETLLGEVSEYFGDKFVEFKQKIEEGEDPLNVADEILNKIGEGSTRAVYSIPGNNDQIIKIINTRIEIDPDDPEGRDVRGFGRKEKIASNRWESDLNLQQKYPDIFPRTFEVAGDHSWILAEKVEPIDKKTFLSYLGLEDEQGIDSIQFHALVELIISHFKNKDDSEHWSHGFFMIEGIDDMKTISIDDTVPIGQKSSEKVLQNIPRSNPLLQSPMARRVRKMISNPHNEKIFRAMADLDIPSREFSPKNVGLSTIGDPHLVILDASLWTEYTGVLKESKKKKKRKSKKSEESMISKLMLDRETSHGGWPEGPSRSFTSDKPVNVQIVNWLKSMKMINERCYHRSLSIGDSDIHGQGIFARDRIPAGTNLGVAQIKRESERHDITDLGRYHNHSYEPSCKNRTIGNARCIIALRDLLPGDEITVDYTLQDDLEQPRFGWI